MQCLYHGMLWRERTGMFALDGGFWLVEDAVSSRFHFFGRKMVKLLFWQLWSFDNLVALLGCNDVYA